MVTKCFKKTYSDVSTQKSSSQKYKLTNEFTSYLFAETVVGMWKPIPQGVVAVMAV